MKDRTWQPLIEGMLEAVWIVDALELRVLAVNRAASEMLGIPAANLVGKPVVELAATPEDVYFWEDVAAGLTDQIHSETLVRRADGTTLPVERRVSRIVLSDAASIFLVGIRDQSEERRIEDELEKLVAELRATLESTADGILVTDPNGVIRGYNHRFAELWDLPQELTTQRNDAAIHGWMAQNVVDATTYAARLTMIARSPLIEATDTLVLKSGKILERVTLPQYARGRPIGRVYSFRDITRRVTDESRLQLAAKVFSASLDAIFVTDPEMTLIDANPACERLTGLSREELIGKHTYDILSDMVSREHFAAQVDTALQTHGYWDGEAWHRNRAGNTLPCQASLVRVLDNQGVLLHTIGFFKDLSETVNAKKRIEELAYTDALTGLPNRLLLNERIEFALGLAHREKIGFALLFLDLDRFKQINDSLGHMFGDRVLVCVAERIKDCLRQVDTAARLGGDEFLILLHKTDARGAEIIARRILNSLSQPFVLDDFSFTITCSIGIALYPDDGETMDDLIKNADAAMYHVKERGRAGFRFYQRQMNVGLLSRMKIDHAMRQALANPTAESHFQLYFQPQVRFSDNVITGAEALLRWRDAELGEIPPAQFIQIAEESGVIVSIGNWVLDAAVAQCAAWQAKGIDLTMAINVSPLQFQQADFVERVGQTLKKYALPPRLLELELTESILIQDVEDAMRRLAALAALGVQLAIDDFGTGYSSLSYLKRFPIHRLKIDRSFIQDLPDEESDTAIVNAIIQLANALRLAVIAEGVETIAQQDFLIAAGCQEYQGYLCTAALPAPDFEAFLARHRQANASQ
ncbi:MAG: EAL domain-containing protein [Rhodocyclaceae bacterium]|nr:EAL domain-containing protein [Rhodocyclaceae bacterium]